MDELCCVNGRCGQTALSPGDSPPVSLKFWAVWGRGITRDRKLGFTDLFVYLGFKR